MAPPGSAHPHVLMHGGGHGRPAEKSISGGCCQDVWTTRATAGAPSILSSPSSTLLTPAQPGDFFFFFLSAEERGGWDVGGVEDEGESGLGGLLFAYV